MEKAIYAGRAYNSTSSAFHERDFRFVVETCVLLLEKNQWK